MEKAINASINWFAVPLLSELSMRGLASKKIHLISFTEIKIKMYAMHIVMNVFTKKIS